MRLQWMHEQMSELAVFYGEDFGQHDTPSEPPHAALPLPALWRGAAAGLLFVRGRFCGQEEESTAGGCVPSSEPSCCPEPASGPSPVLTGVQSRSARTASLPSSRYHEGCRSGASWPAAGQPAVQSPTPRAACGAPCSCACRALAPSMPTADLAFLPRY